MGISEEASGEHWREKRKREMRERRGAVEINKCRTQLLSRVDTSTGTKSLL